MLLCSNELLVVQSPQSRRFAAVSDCRAIAIYDLAGFSVGVMGLGRVLVNHICKAFVVHLNPLRPSKRPMGSGCSSYRGGP